MRNEIAAAPSIKSELEMFLRNEGINLHVSLPRLGLLTIHEVSKRRDYDRSGLFAGGWISCENARALGKQLELELKDVGKVLDFLGIRVSHCSLRCYK